MFAKVARTYSKSGSWAKIIRNLPLLTIPAFKEKKKKKKEKSTALLNNGLYIVCGEKERLSENFILAPSHHPA